LKDIKLTGSANPIVPGQNVDPSMAAGLGQKALLAKRFAKARYVHHRLSCAAIGKHQLIVE
jgi:hypothetical protein